MSPELKAKWVAALRSGKYKQGVGRLASKYKTCFCCLGVLAEITEILYDEDQAWIDSEEAAKLGLLIPSQEHLGNLNDEEKWDFNQIADYIEETNDF